MKINNKLFSEVHGSLDYLSKVQTKAWYAVSKNKRRMESIVEGIFKDRAEIINRLAVKGEDGRFLTQKINEQYAEYVFNSEADKEECKALIEAWENEEIDFEFHQFPLEKIVDETHAESIIAPLIGVVFTDD